MSEIWKLYKTTQKATWEVSNYGNVKMNGELHTPNQNDMYLRCGSFKIHIAVAELFIGPKPGPEYQVDHIDTNRHNNNVDNLRWCTQKENNNNPLTRQHFSEAMKGKPKSEEHKQKMSEFRKGKKHTGKECVYNNIEFGSIKDAYDYAVKYDGYDKSYITFYNHIKG